jgi:preprotein translocase subunit SecE
LTQKKEKSRSLLGLANYYRRFIEEFSKVVWTLSDLLKKWLSQEVG